MGIGLTAYGRREWLLCTLVTAAACVSIVLLAYEAGMWWLLLLDVPVTVWLAVLWFFRDPDRTTPDDEYLLISPADGHVADITNVGADSPLGCEGVKIGIFMNIFDVHVNRSPAAARVVSCEHMDGAFLDARDPTAATRNESTTIRLACTRGGNNQDKEYPLAIRQVAGLIARRIVTDLAEGQQLRRGQRIGMIKFGSRVELFVPRELVGRVEVRLAQRVLAGTTVLVSPPRLDTSAGNDGDER